MAPSGMVPFPASRFALGAPTRADPRLGWDALDQAERDAAYRAAHGAHLDIPYAGAAGDGARTAFDLYPTASCLDFVYGGYWQRNDRAVFACFAEGPSALGWSVAIPGYTLAPEASLTGIAAEIGTCLDWLAEHGPAHSIGGLLVLTGWSAGAQLAALHLGHAAVAAGLAISGVYNLAPIRETGLNRALQLTDAEIAALSPLRLPVTHKPLAIAYGSAERPALVHDARNFHAFRNVAHAPGPLLPVVGADHFSILDELRRPGGLLVRAARDLLEGAPR